MLYWLCGKWLVFVHYESVLLLLSMEQTVKYGVHMQPSEIVSLTYTALAINYPPLNKHHFMFKSAAKTSGLVEWEDESR